MEMKEMNEIWKAIEDYPNYEVSNLGNVRNKKTKRVLRPAKLNTGYLQVRIKDSTGVYRGRNIHRLAMITFNPVENMDDLQVDHIDFNRQNNCLENLRWLTPTENRRRKSGSNRKKVLCVETGIIYQSQSEASRQTGIDQSAISKYCRSTRKTAGGFHWQYID